jgi:4-hydroxybenzoate polyprenyltransferase
VSWLRRTRVGRWVHFLALPLAGFDAHGGLPAIAAALRGVIVAFAVLAFGYTLNALADREMDRPAKNPFAASGTPPLTRMLLAGLAGSALLASAGAPLGARVATMVALASGVVYSVGPRLKRLPIVGSLANLTNFAPLLWVGESDGAASRSLGSLAVAFACLLLQNQLIHEAADREEDVAGGVCTTVATLGPTLAAWIAAGLGLVLVLDAHAGGLPTWLLTLVFAALFPLALARGGLDAPAMARLRLAHRLASFAAGVTLYVAGT